MSGKPPADKKPQPKKVMLSTGRGGSGNIRRSKSTKNMSPLASPKVIELEPPRNRAAYGGRGGSGNVWTHVIEEGVFDRVLNYEINRARVRMEERAHEKAEAEQRKTALRARSHSEAKLTCSEARSIKSRKSWLSSSEQEDSALSRSAGAARRKSLANSFLAPLRNTFRASNGARSSSELVRGGSDSGHSIPSSDRVSLSGLTTQLSPSTPNLSPSTPSLPTLPLPLPSARRRWTASLQPPPPVPDLVRTRSRHLSTPLPPPTQPIPPIPCPNLHSAPAPAPTLAPTPSPTSPITITSRPTYVDDQDTDDDDPLALMSAAAAAASKARAPHGGQGRPSKPRPTLARLAPSSSSSSSPPWPPPASPEPPPRSAPPWLSATATPPPPRPPRSRSRAPIMYTLSQGPWARSTSAIPISPTATEYEDAHADGCIAEASEGDLIDPSLWFGEGNGGDSRGSVRGGHHTEVPTVSSLASVLPWYDLDCIIPAVASTSLSYAE